MEKYTYVKKINKDQLIQELTASGLTEAIDSIEYRGTLLTIETLRDLSEIEATKLYVIVAEHESPDVGDNKIKDRITSAIVFGQTLIVEVAMENIKLNLTPSQIIAILTKFNGVKQMLETGSLYTALETLEKIKPDANISQERINKFKNRIKKYLGIL